VPLSRDDDAPFPSGVPRSALAETFEANGIVLPPLLLNTHWRGLTSGGRRPA